MLIQIDNINFESFSDGICNIYTEDETENKTYKYKNLGFSNRALGYNRVFAAKAVQIQTNSVIRIPQLPGIDTHDVVEILDVGKFEIQLVQEKFNTNPLSTDLTLKKIEMFGVTI